MLRQAALRLGIRAIYPGGHMFYSRPGSQAAFREDVKQVFGAR